MRRRTPNRNGWRGLLKRRNARMYQGGLVYKRPNAPSSIVDLYCCRNPFCARRLRTVPVGSSPVTHCGIKSLQLATMPASKWNQICTDNVQTIKEITARINVAKIRRRTLI